MPRMENDRGRVVDVPKGAVISQGFVFPPGTDIQRDVLERMPESAKNNRPVMPIGRLILEK
jgi:hypothetical protein